MRFIIPPLCLLLALAMLIAGFAVWAVEAPEPGLNLHAARASGDEEMGEVLESQLQHKQFLRKTLLGSLTGGCILMVFLAFLTMRPSGS